MLLLYWSTLPSGCTVVSSRYGLRLSSRRLTQRRAAVAVVGHSRGSVLWRRQEKGESLVLGWSRRRERNVGSLEDDDGRCRKEEERGGAGALPRSVLLALPLPPGRQQPPTFWNAKEPLQGPFTDPLQLFIREYASLRWLNYFEILFRNRINLIAKYIYTSIKNWTWC